MREEYLGMDCSICREQADGLHYGALSCRSCNAFFRRAVTYNQQYLCRFNNDCVINRQGRCSCRACRFRKCLEAGMQISAVQPRRDPTGSQKDRKRKGGSVETDSPMMSPDQPSCSGFSMVLKKEEMDEPGSSSSNDRASATPQPGTSSENLGFTPHEPLTGTRHLDEEETDDYELFERLVVQYGDHLRLMQLAMTSFTDFLEGPNQNGIAMRKMVPTDVEKISNTELSGLLYWIEKQQPYKHLPGVDRTALLKRYSVRKLCLDHFYHACKHKDQIEKGNFVMLNNSFVPPGETGFEGVDDDDKQKKAKREIFLPTFERFWRCVVNPFAAMKITDAEIVFLHAMLLWSPLNHSYVLEETKQTMKERREWHIDRLFEYYDTTGIEDACIRMGEVIMILSEIEVICDQHCQDYQVAKLFEFCDMSKYWYESLCYSSVNTMQINDFTRAQDRTPSNTQSPTLTSMSQLPAQNTYQHDVTMTPHPTPIHTPHSQHQTQPPSPDIQSNGYSPQQPHNGQMQFNGQIQLNGQIQFNGQIQYSDHIQYNGHPQFESTTNGQCVYPNGHYNNVASNGVHNGMNNVLNNGMNHMHIANDNHEFVRPSQPNKYNQRQPSDIKVNKNDSPKMPLGLM